MRLQGMDVPAYFVPGSFHTLADALRVGWHPKYREVLPVGCDATARNDDFVLVGGAQKTADSERPRDSASSPPAPTGADGTTSDGGDA
jgi:hypothetical protein